jgi:hypothetical protein
MVRIRKAVNGNDPTAAIDSPSDSTSTPPPRSILPITPTPSKDHDVVKVNNASLTELKNALDDAIKRVRIIIFPLLLRLTNVSSFYPGPTFSNKFISTLMCALPWAGLVYLLRVQPHFTPGASNSSSLSPLCG